MILKEGLSFDDVLLEPQHGVLDKRKDADLFTYFVEQIPMSIPIVSANMPSVTDGEMARAMAIAGGMGVIHRFNTIKEQVEEFLNVNPYMAACAIGLKDARERAIELWKNGCRLFVLDIAHGDHEQVVKFVKEFHFPLDSDLIVGNVATYDAAARLLEWPQVKALKVGVGPGAACTTREVTGFGVPQLTAIMEVRRAMDEYAYDDATLIADGGIKNSGDIVKALAAGADSVMIGKLLAGCNESPDPGHYYGNASFKMNGHNAPEGVEGRVPLSGPVEGVLKNLVWGIRSGISYAGARNLAELRENAVWIKVTPQTMIETGTRIG